MTIRHLMESTVASRQHACTARSETGRPSALGADRRFAAPSTVLLRAERRAGHNASESKRGPYAARRHARRLPLASTTARAPTPPSYPECRGICDARPGCGGGRRHRERPVASLRAMKIPDSRAAFPPWAVSPPPAADGLLATAPPGRDPGRKPGRAQHLWTAGKVKMITKPPPVLPLATCPPLGVRPPCGRLVTRADPQPSSSVSPRRHHVHELRHSRMLQGPGPASTSTGCTSG